MLRAESLHSLVAEHGEAVRIDLVRGDGGGDHCDFAAANVGAHGDKGAGEMGESTLSIGCGTLRCRDRGEGFRFILGAVGRECCLRGLH